MNGSKKSFMMTLGRRHAKILILKILYINKLYAYPQVEKVMSFSQTPSFVTNNTYLFCLNQELE
jgi:hypothetical protein